MFLQELRHTYDVSNKTEWKSSQEIFSPRLTHTNTVFITYIKKATPTPQDTIYLRFYLKLANQHCVHWSIIPVYNIDPKNQVAGTLAKTQVCFTSQILITGLELSQEHSFCKHTST